MYILAVETSTEKASVCLLRDGEKISYFSADGTRAHNKLLFGMIEDALKEGGITVREVDIFAVGTGPGSFTGLRVGVSAVKGMAIGAGKKIIPIRSIDAAALKVLEDHPDEEFAEILLEGRQKDYFHARYKRAGADADKISEIIVLPYGENCYINGVRAGNVAPEFAGTAQYKGGYYPDAYCIAKLAYARRERASDDYSFEPEYFKEFKVK